MEDWKKIESKTEIASRIGFSFVCFVTTDENKKEEVEQIVIFGGEDDKVTFKDCYRLLLSEDLSSADFECVNVSNSANITVRSFHSTCFDSNSSRL